MRMVADRHRLAAYHAYHNKHCWRAFRGYQHRWPWTTLNPKNMGFKWIFRYFRMWRTLRVNFRWNILEIDQENLHTKLNWCCRTSHELRFLDVRCDKYPNCTRSKILKHMGTLQTFCAIRDQNKHMHTSVYTQFLINIKSEQQSVQFHTDSTVA